MGRTGTGRLIIVCGLPGSGKTTLAKALESSLVAVRFSPDEWMDALARLGARALGAAVELHYVSAPADVLFDRIQRRGTEKPPIERDALSRWFTMFQAPTTEEMALFDKPLVADPLRN